MDVKVQMGDVKFNFRVAGVWLNQDYVLLHRIKHEPFWSLPGGRVAVGEASSTSINREFMEELGIEIKVDRLLGTNENFFVHNEKKVHEIGLYYIVHSEDTNTLRKTGEFYGVEGDDLVYQWVKIDHLPFLDVRPDFLYDTLKELPVGAQHWVNHDN